MAMADFTVKFTQLKQVMAQYFAQTLQKFTTIRNRLNAHTGAKGNVHEMVSADIGLGNVPDWLPATQAQAKRGLSNNAFMTPKRVDDYADENIYKVIGDAFADAADDL
jgi:hypothetical protein